MAASLPTSPLLPLQHPLVPGAWTNGESRLLATASGVAYKMLTTYLQVEEGG